MRDTCNPVLQPPQLRGAGSQVWASGCCLPSLPCISAYAP